MITVKNLKFRYKSGNDILKDINLEINKGECIAIVGENGSGKSTLAKLISGIIKPSRGDILVDEINTRNKKEYIKLRKKIGIVFQNPENQILFNNIEDELSFALENLELDNEEIRIKRALEKVKLNKEKINDIDELSLGQKQRISIASVLAVNPEYIVFDEPTTMIDSDGKEAVYNIIKELKESGYTIIYITNNTEEILLADRIIILHKGKIAQQIHKKDLIEKIDILKKYNLKVPTVIKIIEALRKSDVNIEEGDFILDNIINQIVGAIKNERRN